MSIEEHRRELIEALQELIGERNTATLMESLPPQSWNELATKADLERFATKVDLERFATKVDLERFATKVDLAEVRAELKTDIAELRGDMSQLRSDLVELRAEVRSLAPRLLVASLGSSATLLAFVLGAAAVIR